MKRLWCSIKLKCKHLFLSFKECNKRHLMDDVWYNGELYVINNGTLYDEFGNHYWTIVKRKYNPDWTRERLNVQDCQIKRAFTWFNIKNALFSHYKWWKDYWYEIELRKMMEDNYDE